MVIGASGFEPPTPCSRSRAAPHTGAQIRHCPFHSVLIRSCLVIVKLGELVRKLGASVSLRSVFLKIRMVMPVGVL